MDSTGNMSPSDIKAVMGSDNNGWGNGFWVVFLFFFVMMFGWMGNANNDVATQTGVQNGFDHAAVVNDLNTLNTQITGGFANAEVSRANANTNLMQTLNDHNTSILQSLNGMTYNQLGNAKDTQAAIADLKYTVATENCADRNALNQGLNQLEASIGAKTQAILDKMCQQEIEAYKRENEQLRTQLNMATLAASQNAQTGQIIGQNNIQTQELVNRLATPTPIPAYIVANPFTGTTGGGTADATKVNA